jgi:large subunit ribosomal protein L4
MEINVLNIEGKSTGRSIDLPDDIFGVEANDHLLYLSVKQFLANQRQGTHEARERGVIKGSTRKIKKQKGTGTARAGSIKSPLFRGGGRVFGPRPRDYSQKLNKKVKSLARRVALSQRASEGKIVVVEDFTFESPKTSQFVNVMSNFEVGNQSHLIVLPDYDNNVYLSGRNVKKAAIKKAADLNVYEILKAGKIIMAEGAVEQLKEQYK